jgi:sulfate permease, SulP family
VFDFRLVTGIDSSAMHSFTQIKRVADEVGARLVLVNLSHELRNAFNVRGFITKDVIVSLDLDRAACEQAVIAAHMAEGGEEQTLRDWFKQALGSADHADQLAAVCERLDVDKHAVIAAQGEPADSMHFILEGRIGIILGPHTTIGEMGLITSQLRSATIQAEVPSVLYALNAEAYERIKRENEPLAQALLTYVISIMAERLSFASKVIGVLRR